MPTNMASTALSDFQTKLSTGIAGTVVKDLSIAKHAMMYSLATVIVLNFVYIYLMSWYPETLAKISIVAVNIILVGCIGGLTYAGAVTDFKTYYFCLAGFVFLATLIFNCMLWYRYKHFKVAVAVIDAAADFFASTKRLILVSAFYAALSLIVIIAWMVGSFGIFSLNQVNIVSEHGMYHKEFVWKS